MMAIDDDAAPAVGILQRGADHAGLAAAERRHRVEQVGEAAHAGRERGTGRFVVGGGMPGADDQPGVDQRADAGQRHLVRRQREQAHAATRRAQQRQLVAGRRVEVFRVVHALACRRQVRAFQMDAEHAGHALGQRLLHRGQRRAHHLHAVADQGRQETGGAEAPMRGADPAQCLHRGRLVEQHATAAVDLHVDEAGHEHRAAQVVLTRLTHARIGRRQQVDDAFALQQHGEVVMPAVGSEHAGVGEGGSHGDSLDRLGHLVEVRRHVGVEATAQRQGTGGAVEALDDQQRRA